MGQDRTRWWGQKEVVVKKVAVLQKQVELQEVVEVREGALLSDAGGPDERQT